jgi:hypothetical protein
MSFDSETEYEIKLESMDMESALRIQSVLMGKLNAVSERISQLELIEKQAEKRAKIERVKIYIAGMGLTVEDLQGI